eukprot:scaffold106633_cov19-Tisochrysis_lutea.AAC.1
MDVSQARACPQATAKVLRGCGGGCGGEGGTQLMEHAVPGFSVAAAAATAVHPCARLLLKLPGLGRQQLLHPCMCCEDAHAVVWGQAIGAEGGVHKGGQHLGGSSHFCRLCCFCCCCRCCLLCVAAVVWVAFGVMELPKQAVQLSCGTAHIDLCGTKYAFSIFKIGRIMGHILSYLVTGCSGSIPSCGPLTPHTSFSFFSWLTRRARSVMLEEDRMRLLTAM